MNRNPVLNTPDDITDELIRQIINNDLDSLTINYEFSPKSYKGEVWDEYKKERYRINPFWRANNIIPIKRIEFEIRLGKNVHSLAGAFVEFEELEYVNIQGYFKSYLHGCYVQWSQFVQSANRHLEYFKSY